MSFFKEKKKNMRLNDKRYLRPPKVGLSLTGFTLVEIMIVIMVIVLIAAIAIPNLLRHRLRANEGAAITSLRTLSAAAQSYRAVNPAYPNDLNSLWSGLSVPYIDEVMAGGNRQGYDFSLAGNTGNFTATAIPQSWFVSGTRAFFVDSSGIIRYTTDSSTPPASSSPELP